MEDRERFVARFAAHQGMSNLFSDDIQCREVAGEVFQERWNDALVTVTKLNGERFFID